MITRSDILEQAVNQCMKELYSFAYPKVTWEDFLEQCKTYSKKFQAWERFLYLYKKETLSEQEIQEFSIFPGSWAGQSIDKCIGPKPYEFYYLPGDIMKDICNSYIYAYKLDTRRELLDTIEVLKDYCKAPIVDKYIEGRGKPGDDSWEPGHRSYDHPDNLEKEINKILLETTTLVSDSSENISKELCNKFFEFLDMAGNFYNWTRDLGIFNMNVYLGSSPNSNKEAVIKNWKEYKDIDIEIDEEQIKKDYYGDDDYD